MTLRSRYFRRIARLAVAVVVAGSLLSAPAVDAESSTACQEVSVPATVVPGLPKDTPVNGKYCVPEAPAGVLQILVPGATYDRSYWDFPGFGPRYSYLDHANRAGYATLAIDPVGVGRSAHPPGALVTAPGLATALHDVVQAARSGALGFPWQKVVLVGHSFGTLTALVEASLYQDVDGIIATGASHAPAPIGLATVASTVRPALLDPATRDEVPPGDLSYLSVVGARRAAFHTSHGSDPAVVAADEASRRPGTAGIFATIPTYLPLTLDIRVPLLLVNGVEDLVFCAQGGGLSATDCSTAEALHRSEKPFYPLADVQTAVLPGAGHSINLALNGQDFFARAVQWLDSEFDE